MPSHSLVILVFFLLIAEHPAATLLLVERWVGADLANRREILERWFSSPPFFHLGLAKAAQWFGMREISEIKNFGVEF